MTGRTETQPLGAPPDRQIATADDRWPPQIKYIVGNEACERFSYYGMRSLLMVYVTSVLAKTTDQATAIIHYFIFANYFMPLVGGWLSDRIWGRYHTILWISLFYCAGHAVLALSDMAPSIETRTWCLYVGLTLIAFGSGGIKPCVSAFIGDQFKPSQAHLLQKAYGAFYWSINFGSFFSFLLIPWIKDHHGYGWAFGVPGLAMGIATLIFWLGTRHYTRVPPSRQTRTAGFMRVFWHALTHQRERRAGQGFWDVARGTFKDEEVDAAASVGPILGVFALIPPFWALFDQSTSTWVKQGTAMIPLAIPGWWLLAALGVVGLAFLWGAFAVKAPTMRWVLGVVGGLVLLTLLAPPIHGYFLAKQFKMGAEQMQSANPALVMLLVPLLTLLVYPAVGRLATPLKRMGAGLVLSAASFLIVAWIQRQIETGHSLSLAWQILPYVFLTTGEVLVSTTGLEFAFTEAAKSMKSTIMSFWLLTVAFGNLLVSLVTRLAGGDDHAASVSSGRFVFYAVLTFIVAGAFVVVAMLYRYRNPMNALGSQKAG